MGMSESHIDVSSGAETAINVPHNSAESSAGLLHNLTLVLTNEQTHPLIFHTLGGRIARLLSRVRTSSPPPESQITPGAQLCLRSFPHHPLHQRANSVLCGVSVLQTR
jgi:hypothetical protein